MIVVCSHLRQALERRRKYSEFRRWLREQGAEFVPGKGRHFRVTLNGRTTTFHDHGSKEIGTKLVAQIKKQLGLN
jgi:mRNA interferase HicA